MGGQQVTFVSRHRQSKAARLPAPKAISGDGEDYFHPPCGSLKALVGC